MRRNCRFHGEVITIKNGKYGSMYVPKEESAPKDGKKPSGDNAFDRLQEDIERIKDENIKRNRDNLDALYNIDMRNMSASMKRLFASWSDGIKNANASVETSASAYESAVKLIAEYKTETRKSIADVEAKANENSASITSLTQWKSEVDSSIQSTAQIQQTVKQNEASITHLVEVIGENGETITASIKTAVINDESFIELVADRVTIEGTAEFVKKDDLGDSGSTVVSGNRISVVMNGTSDDELSTLNSSSRIYFQYENTSGLRQVAGGVGLLATGEQSIDHSRYGMYFWTDPIEVGGRGTEYNPAIKFEPAGGFSVNCYKDGPIYLDGRDFTLLKADGGVRIRAPGVYASCIMYYDDSSTDYVFATDGIYYGGKKILST